MTRYAAALLGLPWTGSAHAKDIWTTPEWEKREKLASLRVARHLHARRTATTSPRSRRRERVELVYHGIDLARFPPKSFPVAARDGRNAADPVVILSVARLVEKKGTDVLLEALARLPPSLHWRFVHVGGGPLKQRLERQARALGIAAASSGAARSRRTELLAEYRDADLFALASRVARDGDRDGLPNVLAEAQSQGARLRGDARVGDPGAGARRRDRPAGGAERCRPRWRARSRR